MREGRRDVVPLWMNDSEAKEFDECELFLYAVCELFDDRVSQDFAGNTLDLCPGSLRLQAICKR